MLTHLFDVEASLHILDVTAKSPEEAKCGHSAACEDVARLHNHCRFIGGQWCKTDERLLRLNERLDLSQQDGHVRLFIEVLLDCHTGDHKVGI